MSELNVPEFTATEGSHVVWKYPITDALDETIEFAAGSIVRVDFDPQGALCAWVLVDDKTETVRRRIVVRGTGDPLPAGTFAYLNTLTRGPFVFHAFVGWPKGER